MIEETFSEGNSYLHHFDPRLKIIVAATYSVVTALLTSFLLLAACFLFSLVLVIWGRLNIKKVFKRLLVVNGFILCILVVLPFTYAGEPVFTIGPLVATKAGLLQAFLIAVKSNAIILCLVALLCTSPVFVLVHALHHLKVPSKLVYLFFFTYRYIHVIYMEFSRLRKAMKIRAFVPGTNMHTYKSFAYLVGMLLVRSYERSKRIYQGMLCRGFNGTFYTLNHFENRPYDLASAAVMTCFVVLIAISQWTPLSRIALF